MKPVIPAILIAMSALLSACTSVDYDFSDVKKPALGSATVAQSGNSATGTTKAPRFYDRKPHDYSGKTPWHYPVHGTDVSKYQDQVDWRAVRNSGISFVFIKATEGGDRFDSRFEDHWAGARAAGIPRSAYHFYYFCRSAADQARWYIRNVPKDPHALPPVLDMEWNAESPTCKLRPHSSIVQKEMRIFLSMIERHYGKKPIIYTTVDFFDDNKLSSFADYPFWLRSTAGHPDEKYGPHPWLFWQYTGTGTIPGIKGDADINLFGGSHSQWRKWLESNKVR